MQYLGTRQLQHDIGTQSDILCGNRDLLSEVLNRPDVSIFDDVNTGWVQGNGTFEWDTTDYLSGDRSGKITTSSGSLHGAGYKIISANISNSNIGFWARRSSNITTVFIIFLCPNWDHYISYSVPPANLLSSSWTFISFPVDAATKYGNPNLTNTFSLTVYATGSTNNATLNFDRFVIAPNVFPSGAIILCFDGGFDSDFLHAKRKMDQYNYSGVSFIIPSLIGTSGRLSLDQLRKMQNTGWDICSHSWSHQNLTSLPLAQVHEEIIRAKNYLLGNGFIRGSRFFAYPNNDCNSSVHDIVSKYHIVTRFTNTFSTTHLNAYPLIAPYTFGALNSANTSPTDMLTWIRNVKAGRGLGVMLFHRLVTSSPGTNEYLISDFNTFIDNIAAAGVPVITLSDLVDRYLPAPVSTFEPTAWLNLA